MDPESKKDIKNKIPHGEKAAKNLKYIGQNLSIPWIDSPLFPEETTNIKLPLRSFPDRFPIFKFCRSNIISCKITLMKGQQFCVNSFNKSLLIYLG